MLTVRRLGVAVGLPLCALSVPADAGIWQLAPTLGLSAEYETNPLLRYSQAESGSAFVASVEAPTQWDNDAAHFEVAPRVRLADSTGDSPIGQDAYYLSSLFDLKRDRSEWTVKARWADDSSALREPVAGTLVRTGIREDIVEGSIGWKDSLTERTQFSVNVDWQSLRYTTPGALAFGLFNYEYGTAQQQLTRNWSERVTLQLVTLESRYELPLSGFAETTLEGDLGIVLQATELISCTLQAGASRLRDDVTDAAQSGSTYSANVKRTGLRSSWTLAASKSIQPSGFGTLAEATEADANFDWKHSERLDYSADFRNVRTTNSFAAITVAERGYTSVGLSARYRASEYWDVSGTVGWQRASSGATPFELAASGQGYSVMLSAQRRFRLIKIT
jgi:hypothetical protein